MKLLAWITRYTSLTPEYVEKMALADLAEFVAELNSLLERERLTEG